METLFTANFFTRNREKLKELIGVLPIVITANGQLQKSADTTYPFKQDANFWYATGINEPDLVLVLDDNKEYLILPKRSDYQNIFDGQVDKAAFSRQSGITDIKEFDDGWKQLGARLRQVKQVAIIVPPPQFIEVYGMYTNPARKVLADLLKQENSSLEFVDARPYFTKLRMIKQDQEIEAIKRAIAITAEGLRRVTETTVLKKYTYEYEVEADLTHVFLKQGSNHAFDPIIASGKRACVLHNTGNKGKLSPNELLLFDIGAEYCGYAADISRTVALGELTDRQLQVYKSVLEVQQYAFELLKPGIMLTEYEQQVESFMGEKLRELCLIKTVESSEIRKFYPHATSHHIGLDVHDVDDRKQPLAPNMVITVEPGIYIPEEQTGVRIEDDVLITSNGVEILSSSLPSELV